MNDHKHKIFNPTDCIPEQTMFDYIDNKLSAKERHAVEKHLLDCEFCSDALEGLELVKDRERIGIINQKINEYIAATTSRKVVNINYRTIVAVAAGLALLIGSVFYFNQFTSDKSMDVADLKEQPSEPMPIAAEEITADSITPAGNQTETKEDAAQPLAEKQARKSEGKNTPPALNETNLTTTSPAAGAVTPITIPEQIVNNNNKTIIAGEQSKKSDEFKKEEKEALANEGYSAPAPAPSRMAEDFATKEKEKIAGSAKPLSPTARTKKQKSAAPAYDTDAPKATESDDRDLLSIQSNSSDKNIEKDSVYLFADEMPMFPGGNAEMLKFISANLKYPKPYTESNLSGTVFVQLIVNKEGKITEPKIIKSLNPDMDAEVIRVIKKMPGWKPGKYQGKTVSVRYNLPVKIGLK
jgi:TonB family protein